MNSKELIEILGTDSISTSRIVINHNFKRLADELENYQEYFKQGNNNETFLSVDNVVSRKSDTINFKIGDSSVEPVAIINNGGIETSNISIGDKLTVETILRTNKIQTLEVSNLSLNSTLDELENSIPNLIISTEYGNNGQTGNVNIKGNVKIEGNLSVTGNTPGGSSGSSEGTVTLHEYKNLTQLLNEMRNGYIPFYNNGNLVVLKSDKAELPINALKQLVLGSNFNDIIQYVNRPIIVTGKNIQLTLTGIEANNPGYITNGVRTSNDSNEIVHPGVAIFPTSYRTYFSTIKLTPAAIMWNDRKNVWLNIEILSVPLTT